MPKTFTQYVTPSTSAQSFRPQTIGYDYFRGVEVGAVTADIDPDIQPENIKKDVEILGVVGTFEGGPLQSKSVNSSTGSQSVTSDPSYYGLSSVTVNPYTVEGKSQTITQNGTYTFAPTSADALSDVSISVQVAGTPATVQAKSVSYNVNGEYTVTPDQGYDGLSSVDISVNVPTSSPALQTKTVNSSTASQTVQSDGGYDGLSEVIVNPYVLDSKTVNPSTNQQVVTSDEDGLSSVTVNAMTLQSKDYNEIGTYGTYYESIRPDNGYDGLSEVRVLWPAFMPLNVNSSTSRQVFRPASYNKNYFNSVAVEPYTVETNSSTLTQNGQYTFSPVNADALSSVTVNVSVDGGGQVINNQNKTVNSSTSSQNITADQGYTGLGTVTVNPYTLDTKTVNPSTNSITVNSSADGMSSVTVNAVTASIDPDIQAGNIKKDVEILGVVGTYEGTAVNNQNKTVDPSISSQTITADSGYTGLGTVTVNPVNAVYGSDTITQNGAYTYDGMAFGGDYLDVFQIDVSVEGGQAVNNQNKTVDSSTSSQSVTFDSGYTGLSTVTVNPYTTETDSSTLTANGTYTFTPQNADALSSVTIDVSVDASAGSDWYSQFKLAQKHDFSDVDLSPLMSETLGLYATFKQEAATTEQASRFITALPILDASTAGHQSLAYTFESVYFDPVNGVDVVFPNLVSGEMYATFRNAYNVNSFSLPELTTITSGGFYEAFRTLNNGNNIWITSVSMPKLRTVSGQVQTWLGAHSSLALTIHPDALRYSSINYNLAYWISDFGSLNLTDTVTNDVYLTSTSATISKQVIYEVLSKLSSDGTGKNVVFGAGRTVEDYADGRIQTAYNTAVNNGWTIQNLTITPYSGPAYVTSISQPNSQDVVMTIPDTYSCNTVIEMDYYCPDNTTDSPIGGKRSNYMCRIIFDNDTLGGTVIDYDRDGNRRTTVSDSYTVGARHTLELDQYNGGTHKMKISVDGSTVATASAAKSTDHSQDGIGFNLFGFDIFYVQPTFTYYGFKWYEYVNGTKTLVHDYRPALDTNNVPGFYDEVTQQYLVPTSGTLDYTA
jgi:hypothetical protein